jgi:hypothetical protein
MRIEQGEPMFDARFAVVEGLESLERHGIAPSTLGFDDLLEVNQVLYDVDKVATKC